MMAESSSITLASMTFMLRPGESQVTSAMPSLSVSMVKLLKLTSRSPIGIAVLVRETPAVVVADRDEVDVGIFDALVLRARADFKIDGIFRRAVQQMMPVAAIGFEARGVAGLEHHLAAVLDQHHLAFENEDELILVGVPVPQRRSGAGTKRREIDTELIETGRVAEPPALTAIHRPIERRRIRRPGVDRQCFDVELGHCCKSWLIPAR